MSHMPILLGLMLALSSSDTCTTARTPSGPTDSTITVASLSPDPAEVGVRVTITGSGFAAAGNAVKIGGGYLGDLESADGTTITFTLPNAMAVCNPFLSAPCPEMAMLVTPGEYEVRVLTKRAASNAVTLVVREK